MRIRGGLPHRYCVLAAAIVASTVASLVATAQGAEQNQASENKREEGKLETIIVTAQKREERLQDVPAAVSALTGADLEAMGAESFTDYARSIPGLTFSDRGAGRQIPAIRGIYPSIGAPAVGYYIGETPIPTTPTTNNFAANPRLIDIDRVK